MTLSISRGNIKMGNVPSVSFPPIDSCPKDIPCAAYCYARKMYLVWKNARAAWDRNLALWKSNPDLFQTELWGFLEKKKPPYFRFSVGGDIPTREYFLLIERTAKHFPNTKILAFTKTEYTSSLPNLVLVFSHQLNDFTIYPERPNAFIHQPDEMPPLYAYKHIKGVTVCPKDCAACNYSCWSMKPGELVMFEMHGWNGRLGKPSKGVNK